MTAALITLAVVILALLWLLRDKDKRHQETLELRDEAWTAERRELLNRIQRPELIPVTPGKVRQPAPPKDAQAIANVGTVLPFRDGDPDDA